MQKLFGAGASEAALLAIRAWAALRLPQPVQPGLNRGAVLGAAVECDGIRFVERRAFRKAARKMGIGDEELAPRARARLARLNRGLGSRLRKFVICDEHAA